MADDIFIIDFSGLPYYSKCFGGKTCDQRIKYSRKGAYARDTA